VRGTTGGVPAFFSMAATKPRRRERNARSRAGKAGRAASKGRWSKRVMQTSDALDLEPGVFTKKSPRAIALSLKRSAEASGRRKSDPYRSAMSMLTFHINRGGKGLSAERRRALGRAKGELRALFGRD
jgi:Protein of unknown function (DUF3175)